MIQSGEKKEEYREVSPYWARRLMVSISEPVRLPGGSWEYSYESKIFDTIHFYNGGSPCIKYPNFSCESGGIQIGYGKPQWGAAPGVLYFIINLKRVIT